ncbi:MAG: hypothetical protein AB7Q37_02835 [Pyrinomonadaceae bacterium]
MNAEESRQLRKDDKIDMIVTGGSGRVYRGLIVATDDVKLTIRWDDGEMGHIEHVHADYLRKSQPDKDGK